MDIIAGIGVLIIILAVIGLTIRALIGLFMWRGSRLKALFQIFAIPMSGLLALVLVVSVTDNESADMTPETGGGAEAEAAAPEDQAEEHAETAAAPETKPEPDDAPVPTMLGQWCRQEPFVESLDRIITIFEGEDGALMATVDFRSSIREHDLTRDSDGRLLIADTTEWYELSDDMATLTIGDEQGEIGTAHTHAEGEDCFRPEGAGAAEAQAQAEEQGSCRNQLSCWAERHHIAANVRCRRPIEDLALYSMEWTNRFLEPRMSHFRWLSREDGTITYIGDRARFQNAFGALQNVIYDCDYDPDQDQVLDVRVRPGRINQ